MSWYKYYVVWGIQNYSNLLNHHKYFIQLPPTFIPPPSLHPTNTTHTHTKEKQKNNMIQIIKNNSNLFKCHSFMHLYFHHHHLFQEAHIHRQSHNTNFRFLFFLIQIHYGLAKRFFSFIYRIFSLLLHFDSPWMFWAFKTFFSVSISVPMFIFDFRVYFFVYYIKNAQPTHQNTKIPQFKLYLSFIDIFFYACYDYVCSYVHFRFSSVFFRLLYQKRTSNALEHKNTLVYTLFILNN